MSSLSPTPGLHFAADVDGTRLPVIDVTHPAFAIRVTAAEIDARLAAHRRDEQRRTKAPRWMQWLFYRMLVRRSYFGRRLSAASGGFLDAMSTYRFKLGPGQLDPSWALPFDYKIAASLPALCMRLRLQDMAELLADDLAPRLADAPRRPLHFVAIAGGPCMDNLNALLLLNERAPELLRDRAVQIDVFDQEDAGPRFAAGALEAMQQPGAPLHGLRVGLRHVAYRWDDPQRLAMELAQLPRDLLAAVSSEGGLFDYGSDEDIAANLKVLRDHLPADASVAGSLTQPKPPGTPRSVGPKFAIRERAVSALAGVVAHVGWRVTDTRPRPFQTTFLLRRS